MFFKQNTYAFLINLIIPYMMILVMNEPTQVVLIWPAIGLGVISALVWGYKIIPALYLSQFLLNFLLYSSNNSILHDFLINNLFISIGLIRCYFGAFLFRYFISYPNSMISHQAILKLYLVIGPLIALTSTSLNSLVKFFLNPSTTSASFLSNYIDWWFGDYLGFVIFAPLLLVAIGQPKSIWRPRYFTLVIPTILFLSFIILIYNKTEHSDNQKIKDHFTVKTELVTNIINQKFNAIDQLMGKTLSHNLPYEDWDKKFQRFFNTVESYNTEVFALVLTDEEQTIKYFNPNKTESTQYKQIKELDFSKYSTENSLKYNTNYLSNAKLLTNTFKINGNGKTTTIVVFYDPTALIKNLLTLYNLKDTQVKLTISPLNKTLNIGATSELPKNIFEVISTLHFKKEEWKISFQPTVKYLSNNKVNKNSLMAKIGLIFTGLVSMMLLVITGKTTLTDIKVKERTLTLDYKINQFKEDKKQYQKLIENHPVVLWHQNIKTNQLTYISDKVKEIYGYSKSQWLTTENFRINHIVEKDQEKTINTINQALSNRSSFELEYRFIRSDLSIAWVKDVVSFNKDKEGNAQLVGLMIDTTETHEAKTRQSISESKYRTLFKYSSEPLIIIDLENHLFKDCNDKATSLFGIDNIAGTLTLSDLSPIKQADGSLSSSRLLRIYNQLLTKNTHKFEWNLYNKSHEEIICTIEFTKMPETRFNLILASIIDITEKRQHERKINQLAYYDNLTSLPNREYFYSKFEFFHKLACEKQSFGTIIYLDLDRFKLLNDSLGHQAGDQLLEIVAKRIKSVSRNNDFCARLGGDEFIVLTKNMETNIETALELSLVKSELILEALNEPYQLGDYEHFITPSIGISVYPYKDASIDEIIHQADIAMYVSKDKGKNTITIFQENMVQQVAKKLHLEKAVKDAFDKDEFKLYYQIKVDEEINITSAEALLRWNRLKEFNIDTEKLIETIDTVGLTNELGYWVLDQSCYQLEQWNGKNTIKSLAINISPKQLSQKLFVEQIISVIKSYDISSSQITLELTESVLFENRDRLIQKLQELRNHGIKISLDDFGTGYSSLAYLQKLPIDQLKIDKMFIDNLTLDKSTQHVVKTIINLATLMNIELIVEGIETKQQFEILKSLGVKHFQGYYFAKALPPEQLA